MGRSRSPSPYRRRRSRDRDRERDRDGSSRRATRRRSRDRDRERRRASPERRRQRSRTRSRSRGRERTDEPPKKSQQPKLKERPAVSELEMQGKTDEEKEMLKLMGFGSFDTTKNKHVEDNVDGEVHVILKRKYRQYMNRKGGFNRPLDFVA